MLRKFQQFLLALALLASLSACGRFPLPVPALPDTVISLSDIPEYTGDAYIEVNGNVPFFEEEDLTGEAFETYSPLDDLGRCGPAFANVCTELMPTEERGEIGMIKPSGWHTVRYDDIVNGKYLYNRCHLIGYQLAGENANEKNLITGTRYLNIEGMLPFENMVDDYVEATDNHVLYRVTPIFGGDNLVAYGVLMEGRSVEDEGAGLSFCVFCYNVQPGVTIDYATGESWADQEGQPQAPAPAERYILNTSSKKFHFPDCGSVAKIGGSNYQEYEGARDDLTGAGYAPCGACKP